MAKKKPNKLEDATRILVQQIRDRGLTAQVGQKQVRHVLEAMGEDLFAHR